jgi:hypothetical protein
MAPNRIKKTGTILSTIRDVPMLDFLWRWKVSTTSALAARFFPMAKVGTAYKRLWRLERAGFIRARCDDTASYFLWSLDKRGFAFVRSRLPQMREEGYLSENLKHDLVVTAVHLGDGLPGKLPRLEYATEQELRRYEPEYLQPWVPRSNRHRPDGYWQVNETNGPLVIALEVELSSKTEADYESIGRFYSDYVEIHQVIWVVEKPQFADKIRSLLGKRSNSETQHGFALLGQLSTLGWQAEVSFGSGNKKTLGNLLGNCATNESQPVGTQLMLDVRKTPHKSKHCRSLWI